MLGEEGIDRRTLLTAGAAAAGALTFGAGVVKSALAAPAKGGPGPYGELLAADANGVMLPPGFTSRRIATAGMPVGGTSYLLPIFPDGSATFRTKDGGWILATNAESISAAGSGASGIRFDKNGAITAAYRILGDTNFNCAGGPTPWGTWLSGEEADDGMIWECDPAGRLDAEPRPMMGLFRHEAAAVDPVRGHVYLTEDDPTGCFYRFTPAAFPSLDSGLLEAAVVGSGGKVTWREVPDPTMAETGIPTQNQAEGATRFEGGEGLWYARGVCHFTTKGDKKVWTYDTRTKRVEVIFDAELAPDASLDAVDNVTVSALGDVFVCEDGGNREIGLISRENTVSPMMRLPGPEHGQSEICGVCFDPSGKRMYFTSQRGGGISQNNPGTGQMFEVKGPFRLPKGGQPGDFIYGPPAGEARPNGPLNPGADKRKPRVKVMVKKRIGADKLGSKGLRVKVKSKEPVQLAMKLLSTGFGSFQRPDDPQPRPRSVPLAKLKLGEAVVEMNQGEATRVKLELGRKARKKLEKQAKKSKRPLPARLITLAVDGNGNKTAKVSKLKIDPR